MDRPAPERVRPRRHADGDREGGAVPDGPPGLDEHDAGEPGHRGDDDARAQRHAPADADGRRRDREVHDAHRPAPGWEWPRRRRQEQAVRGRGGLPERGGGHEEGEREERGRGGTHGGRGGVTPG